MGKTRLFSIILSIFVSLFSVGGVFASWLYANGLPKSLQQDVYLDIDDFIYTPVEMPNEEVSVVQRLSDILNKKYSTDKISNSLDYLINETIQVYWGGNIYADPYVGSMDKNFTEQITELFRDVITDTTVSFILKNQDLNGDGFREIAMYSTSDPLDCVWEFDGIVCVYVTVFTPRIDANKNIIGYNLVCESMRGYCHEVFYGQGDNTPSFSTDEWKDDIGYYHYFDETYYRIPLDAMSLDGSKPLRNDYNSYNKAYEYESGLWGSTAPFGNKLWQCLGDKIPYLF